MVFFKLLLLLKWPDSILRQSFKWTVIWKHMNHFLWPFPLKLSANLLFSWLPLFTEVTPLLDDSGPGHERKTGRVMCLSMNSRTSSFLPICVSFWEVNLSDLFLCSSFPSSPALIEKHNLIISEQELLFLLKDSHLLSTPRIHFLAHGFLFTTLMMNQKASEMEMFSGSGSGLFY